MLAAAIRALAAEWGSQRVRVNAVQAGLVGSESTRFLTEYAHLRHRYE